MQWSVFDFIITNFDVLVQCIKLIFFFISSAKLDLENNETEQYFERVREKYTCLCILTSSFTIFVLSAVEKQKVYFVFSVHAFVYLVFTVRFHFIKDASYWYHFFLHVHAWLSLYEHFCIPLHSQSLHYNIHWVKPREMTILYCTCIIIIIYLPFFVYYFVFYFKLFLSNILTHSGPLSFINHVFVFTGNVSQVKCGILRLAGA